MLAITWKVLCEACQRFCRLTLYMQSICVSARLTPYVTVAAPAASGIINDSIYAQDCRFADPTVSFTGLDLWKRNLQLLVPFLVEPRIQLLSLKNLGYSKTGAQQLKAEWTLQTCLSLPWRPVISILGSTVYTLSREGNKVVEHVEGWNVTPVQALLAVFTPGHARS
eukprot:GHRR01019057.1.p2 GENE.GHRR01019057.1~~GHRR01019057.1.p2  ORF type:complete len:167 (+),score=31.89 GHRR01019057.1:648-1148(+)